MQEEKQRRIYFVQRIKYDEDVHPGVAPVDIDIDLSRYEKVVTDALPAGLPPERQILMCIESYSSKDQLRLIGLRTDCLIITNRNLRNKLKLS